ncbi:hypothetical protein RRG08_040423 [Elysia crispata]|uniref:Uncharacterized protein n=1 Tax=Elysia crispata TaxID=231223 RepID=A0AAE0ZCX7_9GAST|nr:hypothetical protein RRG08_040423 [Elysia crispata]
MMQSQMQTATAHGLLLIYKRKDESDKCIAAKMGHIKSGRARGACDGKSKGSREKKLVIKAKPLLCG